MGRKFISVARTSPPPPPPQDHKQDGVGGENLRKAWMGGGQNVGPRLNGIRDVLPRRAERKQSPIPVWREEKPRLRAEGTRPSPVPANSPISTPRVLQVGATHLAETSDPSPPSPGRVPDLSLALNHQLEVFMCVCVCVCTCTHIHVPGYEGRHSLNER